MRKNLPLTIAFLGIILSGCSGIRDFFAPHKVSTQQGSKITQKMVDQLRPKMTKAQVRYVLGTPLVADTFHQDRWDYQYSFIHGDGRRIDEHLTVYFTDELLERFEGDFKQKEDEVASNQEDDATPETKN